MTVLLNKIQEFTIHLLPTISSIPNQNSLDGISNGFLNFFWEIKDDPRESVVIRPRPIPLTKFDPKSI